MRDLLDAYREDIEAWAQQKSPWWRVIVLAYFVYAGIRHILSNEYTDWFKGITLVFHEMGHILFIPLGRTLTILGGSLTQLIVPLTGAIYLMVKQRDYFGFVFGLGWLALSLFDLAVYVGDANREELPLVSMGADRPLHDWGTLLTEWHVLNHTALIAKCVTIGATVVWLVTLGFGAWLVRRIVARRHLQQ